jgi:putative peptidoglycan lipid II flippase
MVPFFLLAFFLNWMNDDAAPLIGVVRLLIVLIGSGAGFLLVAHALKITEITAMKEFAISLLGKRRAARAK